MKGFVELFDFEYGLMYEKCESFNEYVEQFKKYGFLQYIPTNIVCNFGLNSFNR